MVAAAKRDHERVALGGSRGVIRRKHPSHGTSLAWVRET